MVGLLADGLSRRVVSRRFFVLVGLVELEKRSSHGWRESSVDPRHRPIPPSEHSFAAFIGIGDNHCSDY